jgi:hypothetical protein
VTKLENDMTPHKPLLNSEELEETWIQDKPFGNITLHILFPG